MERVNRRLNTYDPGSEVSQINQQAVGDPVPVSLGTMEVLKRVVTFWSITGGALDITVGTLLKLWSSASMLSDYPGGCRILRQFAGQKPWLIIRRWSSVRKNFPAGLSKKACG